MTIDAMGCQTAIAEKIIKSDADYCLAVKDNQPKLHEAIQEFFTEQLDSDFADTPVRRHESHEKGHGRETDRYYYICPVPEDLATKDRWHKLKAIGVAISCTVRNRKESNEARYYILSSYTSGKRFAEAVREHWSIENNLHWQLDVTFGEDQSRIRKGHADANFSVLRRSALSILKREQTVKVFDTLNADPRVCFLQAEPIGLEMRWRKYTQRPSFSPKIWNDAYLAAFATSHGINIVTFDKGFAQFDQLACTILS